VDALHPLHSGQAGGLVGRLLVFAAGLALLGLCGLGVALAWIRRKPRG